MIHNIQSKLWSNQIFTFTSSSLLTNCHQQINFDKFNLKVYYFLLTKESLGITIVQSIIVLLEHFRGVFRTLANIPVKGGSFCETSERLKAMNFFRKTLLHLRYLTGLWKSFCMELFDCYTPFSKIVLNCLMQLLVIRFMLNRIKQRHNYTRILNRI